MVMAMMVEYRQIGRAAYHSVFLITPIPHTSHIVRLVKIAGVKVIILSQKKMEAPLAGR